MLLKRPDLRHRASNLRWVRYRVSLVNEYKLILSSPHSELYVTAQLWADSKPLTVPVQTAYKVFKNGRIWNEWLTLPITYSNIPLSSQLAITVWDLSPTGGEGSKLHAIPFGGTTIPLFDNDNTLQKGRQRCRLHRHKAADGLSSSTTPWIIPPARRNQKDEKASIGSVNEQGAEMERLEGLLKKQEMGEIPPNAWLDQMVFRQMMKLRSNALKSEPASSQKEHIKGKLNDINGETPEDGMKDEHEEKFYIHIEFPRFDHPIVFTDQEYPAPPISSIQLPASSSEVRLKPPPEVSFGPGINVDGNGYGDVDAGRLVRIYDPEVGMRDNPAENKHRRLVRSHRTGVLDRDLKPNAKIRDELNVRISHEANTMLLQKLILPPGHHVLWSHS